VFGYFQESERLISGVRVQALQLWRPQPCIDDLVNVDSAPGNLFTHDHVWL
jgi:hypothetical protein